MESSFRLRKLKGKVKGEKHEGQSENFNDLMSSAAPRTDIGAPPDASKVEE